MKKYCTLFLLAALLTGSSFLHAQAAPDAVISFPAPVYLVSEAGGKATITVNLLRNNGIQVVFAFQCYTVNVTATEDNYQPVDTAVAFGPGETSKTFTVPIVDDNEAGPNKSVF